MAASDTIQVFTVDGRLVGDVKVTLLEGGRYPKAVEVDGRTYVLDQGRYVEAPVAAGERIRP